MTETVSIQDKQKRFTLVVKKEFLTKCPDPGKHTVMELHKDFNCLSYLHNEAGPAVISHKPKKISDPQLKLNEEKKYYPLFDDVGNRLEFWLDGRCISREDPIRAERMNRTINFKAAVEEIVDSA